jgi:hypothetical protein
LPSGRIRVLRKYKNKLKKKKPLLAGERTLYRIGIVSLVGGSLVDQQSRIGILYKGEQLIELNQSRVGEKSQVGKLRRK